MLNTFAGKRRDTGLALRPQPTALGSRMAGRAESPAGERLPTVNHAARMVYDYAYEREGRMRPSWRKLYACHCGSKNCRGTILKRARSRAAR